MQPSSQDPDQEQAHLFPPDLHDVRDLQLQAVLLVLWVMLSFVAMYFARDLARIVVAGWPRGYWIAAQGGVVVFIGIVVAYGWAMNRLERLDAQAEATQASSPPKGHG